MIELLIVIAVLGVLAVAVLSAINPIEQINRGRDTGSRSDAEQLLSAFDRFYTTQEIYPWQDASTTPSSEAIPLTVVDASWNDEADAPVLPKLTTGGTAELKTSMVTRISNLPADNKLQVYCNGTQGDSVYVCFLPRSGAFQTEAQTRCTSGLPDDIDAATQAVICTVDAELVCLP